MPAATPDPAGHRSGSRRHLPLTLCLLGCALVGCTTPPAATGSPAPSTGDFAAGLQSALDTRDRQAFVALLDPAADPGRVDLLWTNLVQFDVDFSARGDRLAVAWSVPGEAAPARQVLAFERPCDSCAPTDLVAVSGQPAPLWLVEGVVVERRGAVTLIRGLRAPSLMPEARAAVAGVAAAGLGGLASGWDGALVLEQPSDPPAFARVMADQGDLLGTAAVTVRRDSVAEGGGADAAAAVRVVVNPAATTALPGGEADRAADPVLAVLIGHEAVHVATAAQPRPAAGRLWVSEGLAEWLALGMVPGGEQAMGDELARACRQVGRVPGDAELAGALAPEGEAGTYGLAAGLLAAALGEPGVPVNGGFSAAQLGVLTGLWQGADPAALGLGDLVTLHRQWCAGR